MIYMGNKGDYKSFSVIIRLQYCIIIVILHGQT